MYFNRQPPVDSRRRRLCVGAGFAVVLSLAGLLHGQEALPPPRPGAAAAPAPPPGAPYPINLATALQLADAQNLDVALASERVQLALAEHQRAKVLWLPTILWGGDYFRHDGQIQDVGGAIFGTGKSSLMAGAGPNMVFAASEAVFAPLAARQVWQARQAALQAACNDTTLAVAEAYFNVQQARGGLLGAEDAVRRAEEVLRRVEKLAPDLVPRLEIARTRAELARRRQATHAAREQWQAASAELVRLLRLDPAVVVEPVEPPSLQVPLIPPDRPVDDLIAQALTARPELAAQQALVQATLYRLREARIRPLVPSVLLRGAATNPAGTLSSGVFGGGRNSEMANGAARNSLDLQLIWEIQNLGFGNRAQTRQRKAEHEITILELFRTQDRIAAEVVQAHAQVVSAAARAGEAETGLADALESAVQNLEGMGQTKRLGGNVVLLVVRPQEAVAAIQALAQAYGDFYGAANDFNRAQFRLYRALGNSAPAPMPAPADGQPPPCVPAPGAKNGA